MLFLLYLTAHSDDQSDEMGKDATKRFQADFERKMLYFHRTSLSQLTERTKPLLSLLSVFIEPQLQSAIAHWTFTF